MEDKEKAIRLQFLDEAGEYLDTLESALLGVSARGVDSHEINGALRAAHSIKGGAALMGYGLTSELAHRLEDSLKVLKIQRSEKVSADVEGRLLSGVDAIRQIVECDRLERPATEPWISETVLPIFDWLHETLGEPGAEDAGSIMDSDEGHDVLPLIFQTEVESALERLEMLIDEQPLGLKEDIIVMAQEMSSLGEMLDLPPFVQLCQSVEQHVQAAANPAQVQEIARRTLQAWRRAQALVLTNNIDSMPHQLDGVGIIEIEFDESNVVTAAGSQVDLQEDLAEENDALVSEVFAGLGEENDALVSEVFAGLGEENDALVHDVFSGLDLEADTESLTETIDATDDPSIVGDSVIADPVIADSVISEPVISDPVISDSVITDPDLAHRDAHEQGTEPDAFAGVFETPDSAGTAFRFSETPKAQTEAPDLGDNTVRVSVRKLNELNDYFGELTIERNRLEAEVKRMRRLVKDLGQKLRSLDEINDDVRDVYEKPEQQLLLSAASSAPVKDSVDAKEPSSLQQAPFRQDFDALEFDRYHDSHLPFRQIVESVVKLQEVADDLELSVDKTEQTTRVIHRTARHLQRNLNQLRMRPLSDITNRFPRALRELELKHGKSVTLALEGESVLIDRNILESLNDPLMHIVRNAFDHGIETPQQRAAQGKSPAGTIAIQAFNRNNRTVITVSDDGNGIALDKIRDRAVSMGLDADLLQAASKDELLSLIFEPGFSTSDEVTALSGRGVGMDVVRNNLTQIRGDINVQTHSGQGTTFTISVPYTLSVTRVMLAEGNRMPIALPTDFIEEVTVAERSDRFEKDNKPFFNFKGEPVRLIQLANWLSFNCPRQYDSIEEVPTMDRPSVLLFRAGEQRIGVEIDRSWGEREVAVRRVEGPISLPAGFSNCTILGDGKVIPLISLPDFARWVLSCEASGLSSAQALYANPVVQGALDPVSLQTIPDPDLNRSAKFLVIDDSVNVRRLLALTLEKAGYDVEQARDGEDAFDKLENGLAVDSIVCDVEMPRMDGYSFLSKLRSRPEYADIPVTMLTSRSGEKHRKLAMNLGATAYFSKPYQERVLLQQLKDDLAASKAQREKTK
ncbi:MAG: response regulator [Cyanobacteria bacterium P01_D01_bin.105]